jgi:hypothetical protein
MEELEKKAFIHLELFTFATAASKRNRLRAPRSARSNCSELNFSEAGLLASAAAPPSPPAR